MAGLQGPLFGRFMVAMGTVVVFPDALFVRFLVEGGAGPYCILAWKGFFKLVMIGVYVVKDAGGPIIWIRGLKHGKIYLTVALVVFAGCDIGNNLSLTYTSAANALLFVSMNPPWASLLGLVVLRERLPLKTWVTLFVAVLSAVVIALPSFIGEDDEGGDDDVAQTSLLGDVIGLLTGFLMAAYVTILRLASHNCPECDTASAPTLAYAFGVVVATMCAQGKVWPSHGGWDPNRPVWQFWAAVFLDASACVVYDFCTTIGAEYISGAEVGLIQLMESVGGPFCIFLFYGDVPGMWTLVGGGVLLAALWIHEALGLWAYRQEARRLAKLAEARRRSSERSHELYVSETSVDANAAGQQELLPGGRRNSYRASAVSGTGSLRRGSRTSSNSGGGVAIGHVPSKTSNAFSSIVPSEGASEKFVDPGPEKLAAAEEYSSTNGFKLQTIALHAVPEEHAGNASLVAASANLDPTQDVMVAGLTSASLVIQLQGDHAEARGSSAPSPPRFAGGCLSPICH